MLGALLTLEVQILSPDTSSSAERATLSIIKSVKLPSTVIQAQTSGQYRWVNAKVGMLLVTY